jgi:histidine triad (HIT) family protein
MENRMVDRSGGVESTCVFCEIIGGEAPATIIEEWPDALAIVPLGPVVDGHVLVIPREHVRDVSTSPEVSAATMARAAEYAARHDAVNIITSQGAAATQSVPHLHLHVVPRTVDDGLMTPWGTVYGDDPRAQHWCRTAQQLQDRLDRMTAIAAVPVDAGVRSAIGTLGMGALALRGEALDALVDECSKILMPHYPDVLMRITGDAASPVLPSLDRQRLDMARVALIGTGYFTEDQVGDDIAPRITEMASDLGYRIEELEQRLASAAH